MYSKEEFKKELFYAIGSDEYWHFDRWINLIEKVEKVGIMAETVSQRRYYRWLCEEIDHVSELDNCLEKLVSNAWHDVRMKIWKEIAKDYNR